MMNVVHISTVTSWRGGEQQVLYLTESLKKQDIKQYVICVKDSALAIRLPSYVEKIELPKPNLLKINWIHQIRKVCREKNIQLIHVHESKAHTFALLAALFFKTPPIVVTRRVVFPVRGYLSKLKYKHKSIKKIICISNAVQQEMLKIVEQKNTEIINSCIDINKFKDLNHKQFSFLSDSKVKIGYVAALTKEKDHGTFLKVAKELSENHKKLEFYIIGDGKLEKQIATEIKKQKLTNAVKMTGFVREISELIPQLDILLFTSVSEGLGSTILDFFLAKKPVVVANSKGVTEVVRHNETGLMCNIGDVDCLVKNVSQLLTNNELKNKLVDNGYQLVTNNYTIKQLGEKHYSLYSEIID